MRIKLLLSIVVASVFASPSIINAQSLPATGALLCDVQYEHGLPVGGESKNMITESAGICGFGNDAMPGGKVTYTVGLEFNDKGVGKLLFGGGHTTLNGKPMALQKMLDAKYILKMKDGKVVGWTSSGRSIWTAGELAGRIHTWSAKPTGKTTIRIDYESKE